MTPSPSQVDMETMVSLCKRRGFIFQSSEIYGGLASTWDYGPLGVELKRNVKEAWWRSMVWDRDDMVGLDAAIMMNSQVWVASGHAEGFTDPLVECLACNQRFRPDHVLVRKVTAEDRGFVGYLTGFSTEELQKKRQDLLVKIPPMEIFEISPPETESFQEFLDDTSQIPCPFCGIPGRFTEPRQFNLMFKTFVGPVEDTAGQIWLRPETAQGIFVNFDNVLTATRKKLPFGIAQIGKAFRNEITVGNFVFRTREFEQMEMEYFVKPDTDEEWYRYWTDQRYRWYLDLGIREENLRVRQHQTQELAHYAKATSDIEYRFPWGWDELEGIANRTDFDLKAHSQASGHQLDYFDDDTKERYVPYVIEPSGGVDRSMLAFLLDAYREEMAPTAEKGKEERRVVLKLHPALAPVKVAVLPLSRNERLVPMAREVYDLVRGHGWTVQYDDAQSIGRRYRRQDEAGTPLCVTVDFDSLEDRAVTIRDRDTMAQVRVPIATLVDDLRDKLA